MPTIDLGEQRIVVSGVLVQNIVFDDDYLQFFHVESRVHLDCAFVYHFNNAARLLLVLLVFRIILRTNRFVNLIL